MAQRYAARYRYINSAVPATPRPGTSRGWAWGGLATPRAMSHASRSSGGGSLADPLEHKQPPPGTPRLGSLGAAFNAGHGAGLAQSGGLLGAGVELLSRSRTMFSNIARSVSKHQPVGGHHHAHHRTSPSTSEAGNAVPFGRDKDRESNSTGGASTAAGGVSSAGGAGVATSGGASSAGVHSSRPLHHVPLPPPPPRSALAKSDKSGVAGAPGPSEAAEAGANRAMAPQNSVRTRLTFVDDN